MGAPSLPIRDPQAQDRAVACLRLGELIIVATDTIYGIAALPGLDGVIERLYRARGRTQEPALPFLIAGIDEMDGLVRVTPAAHHLAHKLWPGQMTLILPPAAELPLDYRTRPIAVRVPNHPPLLALLERAGGRLLMSGAIRSGYPPAITAAEAAEFFRDDVALILDGGTAPYGVPSTIVDCTQDPPAIVRHGAVPDDKIRKILARGPTAPHGVR